jgi:hypothetical protein
MILKGLKEVFASMFLNEKKLKTMVDQAALPLESIPGTAQVDFGTAPFVYQQVIVKAEKPYNQLTYQYSFIEPTWILVLKSSLSTTVTEAPSRTSSKKIKVASILHQHQARIK